ncbi:MAG: efflux RND transporter permease subunit [Hymenobacter sp.]
MAVVTARLDGRDLGSAVQDIRQRVGRQLALPPGYTVQYGGAYAEQQASFRELLLILLTASLLVLTVLLFLFREWLAVAARACYFGDGHCGLRAGAVICRHPAEREQLHRHHHDCGHHRRERHFHGATSFMSRCARRATWTRPSATPLPCGIRPKLMTAIGAILALSPLALGIGLGAQMQQPLAVAVIGGFVVALPLLLFVLPTGMRLVYYRRRAVG